MASAYDSQARRVTAARAALAARTAAFLDEEERDALSAQRARSSAKIDRVAAGLVKGGRRKFFDEQALAAAAVEVQQERRALRAEAARLRLESDDLEKEGAALHAQGLALATDKKIGEKVLADSAAGPAKARRAAKIGAGPGGAPAAATAAPLPKDLLLADAKLELEAELKQMRDLAPRLAAEAGDWARRASRAAEALGHAEERLSAMPRRYRQTPAEARAELLGLQQNRQALEEARAGGRVRAAEAADGEREASAATRDAALAEAELKDAREDARFWRRRAASELARLGARADEAASLRDCLAAAAAAGGGEAPGRFVFDAAAGDDGDAAELPDRRALAACLHALGRGGGEAGGAVGDDVPLTWSVCRAVMAG